MSDAILYAILSVCFSFSAFSIWRVGKIAPDLDKYLRDLAALRNSDLKKNQKFVDSIIKQNIDRELKIKILNDRLFCLEQALGVSESEQVKKD